MNVMLTLGGCLEQVRTFYLSQDKDFLSKQQQVYGIKHFNFSTSVNFSCNLSSSFMAVVICYNGQHNLVAKKLRDKLQGLFEELTPFNCCKCTVF